MTAALPPARTLVTGGAGFIAGELIETLLRDGSRVTVLDDFSTSAPDWFDRFASASGLAVIEGDAANPDTVRAALAGHERVVHLASGTDIAGGFARPWLDFRNGIIATEVVCEAMRESAVTELWYASSGVVYGHPTRVPTAEGDGPLLPESHYAAAKLAGEAIVSGFAHLYGWRAFAFRFGNTVGPRSDHGVVHDLVVKLLRDPTRLEILGDGTPAKPYVAVGDLVAGMRHAARVVDGTGSTVLNIGPAGTVSVRRVAEIVIDALEIDPGTVEITFTSGGSTGRGPTQAGLATAGGWPGDTTLVEFDISAIRRLGWEPTLAAEDAIRAAAVGIATRYRHGSRPLLTSIERRALAPMPVLTTS